MKSKLKSILIKICLYFPVLGKLKISKVFLNLFSDSALNDIEPYQSEILKYLDRFYRRNKYEKYMTLFHQNSDWLLECQYSKYFSWAAIISKGSPESLEYICDAIYVEPKAINDITTAIVRDKYPDKSQFQIRTEKAALSSLRFTPIVLSYILANTNRLDDLRKLLSKEYIISMYSDIELLETYSILGMNELVVKLFSESKDTEVVTILGFEIVYDSLTKLNRLDEAESLFNKADSLFNVTRKCVNKKINPHAINNKLERQFWFQKNNLYRAYNTYKRQRLSQELANVLSRQYTQDLDSVIDSNRPLIVASWGPGDELRFANIYQVLEKLVPQATVTCEPRLRSILAGKYPNITFVSVARTRRVDENNAHLYSRLPKKKLHHVFDNTIYGVLDNYDKVTLVTDILSELLTHFDTLYHSDKSSNNSLIGLVHRSSQPVKIGISWRSSILTAGRSEHYFSVDDVSSIFSLPNVELFSLQYGDCEEELKYIRNMFGVEIIEPNIDQYNDLESTLELISGLDLVLSVGTTVLELSGLSGTPTIALTNSKAFTYRCGSEYRDYWFKNVNYIPDFTKLSKSEVVNKVSEILLSEKNIQPHC